MRLLVAEGNSAPLRARQAEVYGRTYSDSYAEVLRSLAPDAVVDVCFPSDAGANLPDAGGLAGYDGVAMTGSALNIYAGEPESVRQIEFARAIFSSGVPFFGSCWGLQVATVAAGGDVQRSPKGREIGFARKITLTEAGAGHLLHRGKGPAFDAPAVHTDIVAVKPEGMTVTATNAFCEVQGAEIRHGKGTFWGVQYHPEFRLAELASIFRRYGMRLVEEGFFADQAALDAYVADLMALDAAPSRSDLAWRLGIDADVLEPVRRLAELSNWLEGLVRPWTSAQGRG